MYIFVYIITNLILVNADVDKKIVSSEDKFDTYQGERIRKSDVSIPKRFLEDMNDYEWHISHLKDTELESGRRHCKETFEDKVKKYKRMLANDASRIEFVSADPIPVDEKDLIPEKCEEIDNATTVNTNASVAQESNKTADGKMRVDNKKEEKLEVKNAATTVKDHEKVKKAKDDKGRRASEYLFSSVEYYDEVPDFDDNTCPDVVQVVTLHVDSIKPYDVECELMLEWHSLT